MPYQPRPPMSRTCAHCGCPYTAHHVRRLYCSHSCNVRASHARNGRPKARPARPEVPIAPALPVPAVAVAPSLESALRGLAMVRQFHDAVVAALASRARPVGGGDHDPKKGAD